MKTRSLAKRLCDAGLVAVNGAAVKSSSMVRANDRVTVMFRSGAASLSVVRIPGADRPGKKVQLRKAQTPDYFERVDTPHADIAVFDTHNAPFIDSDDDS